MIQDRRVLIIFFSLNLGVGSGSLGGGGLLMDNLISVDGTDQYQLIEETQLLDLGGMYIIITFM